MYRPGPPARKSVKRLVFRTNCNLCFVKTKQTEHIAIWTSPSEAIETSINHSMNRLIEKICVGYATKLTIGEFHGKSSFVENLYFEKQLARINYPDASIINCNAFFLLKNKNHSFAIILQKAVTIIRIPCICRNHRISDDCRNHWNCQDSLPFGWNTWNCCFA